ARRRRQNRGPEYRAAVRAVSESLHHALPELRVPLLLHAQILVCVSLESADRVSGRLRNAGRDDGVVDPQPDPEVGEEDYDPALWIEVLEGDRELRRPGEVRDDLPRGPQPVPVCRRSTDCLRVAQGEPDDV